MNRSTRDITCLVSDPTLSRLRSHPVSSNSAPAGDLPSTPPGQIQHQPGDPEKSRIAGESDKIKSIVFTGIGIFGALIGLGCVVSCLRTKITIRRVKSAPAA